MPQAKSKKPSRKKKPQKFDPSLKEWIEQQASDILPLLLPGTVYEQTLNVEVNRSMMRADKVFKILYCEEEHILHLEFETRSDADLRARLLIYNSVLYRDHKLPVITIVIYPFPVEQAQSPLCIKSNGKEILTFNFRTLPLFTLEAEQFVQEHQACMYPLIPAMKGVHAELILQVMEELTELYHENQTSLAQQFVWMEIFLERTGTITPLEKDRIEERLKMFDQLWNESPRVQRMKKQFREDARKEAQKEAEQEMEKRMQEMEKAKTEQELKTLRNAVVNVTHVRFPNLTEFARQHVELFDKPEVLNLLIQQVVGAPDANAARSLLNPSAETHEQ